MKEAKFTPEQLRQFRRYEQVRAGGRFNMFDPRARAATGLSGDEYFFVIDNYDALRAEASKEKSNET